MCEAIVHASPTQQHNSAESAKITNNPGKKKAKEKEQSTKMGISEEKV